MLFVSPACQGGVVTPGFNSASPRSLLIPALSPEGGRLLGFNFQISVRDLLIPTLVPEGVHVSRARGAKDSVDIKTSTLVYCPAHHSP